MTLLDQCKIWNENDEYQKIIEALEAVPAQERTPEMDSELAGPTTIWGHLPTVRCSKRPSLS